MLRIDSFSNFIRTEAICSIVCPSICGVWTGCAPAVRSTETVETVEMRSVLILVTFLVVVVTTLSPSRLIFPFSDGSWNEMTGRVALGRSDASRRPSASTSAALPDVVVAFVCVDAVVDVEMSLLASSSAPRSKC